MLRVLDLASPERSVRRDRALGAALALVAGATNAGGFIAVGHYTSHMTGIVSALAEDIAFARTSLALAALGSVAAFVCGAMTTAITVNWARRREMQSRYAIPLLIEAALLLAFGLLGKMLAMYTVFVAPLTVLTLCFLMGLQNAVITKVSGAVIRTTHVTGLLTDIGIELGRMAYLNRAPLGEPVRGNRVRLFVHLTLLGAFTLGGILGSIGFRAFDYFATLPLAGLLVLLGTKPLLLDLRHAVA